MGKKRKLEPVTVQGICVDCNERPQRKAGKTASGETKYSSLCGRCTHTKFPQTKTYPRPERYWETWERSSYRRHKEDKCNACGFVAEDPCQLDVDHIDGNHANDDPDNLQTLCANCHRLKTKMNGDGVYRHKHKERIDGRHCC